MLRKGLVLALVLSMVFVSGVLARPAITLIVNGQRSDAEVRIINGVTFLPLRAVATLLGVPVHWDSVARTITVGTTTTATAPATAPASPAMGTRQNPVPIGTRARVGTDWDVTVLEVLPDAWETMRATNPFNEPPAPGHQFIMARIRVSYVGSKSGTPWLDLSLDYVGADGNTYDGHSNVIPNPFLFLGEMFPGAIAEGNIAWSVPIAAVRGGTIIAETGVLRRTRVFYTGVR